MTHEPNPPGGTSYEASWLRRIWAALRARQILPGRGYRVKYTTNGTILEVEPGTGGKSTPPGPGLTMFKIVELYGTDYFRARTWNGSRAPITVGDTDYFIAKDFAMRVVNKTTEAIDGVTFTYTYPADATLKDNNRTSDDGTNTEVEVAFPRYIVAGTTDYCQGVVYAMEVSNGVGLRDAATGDPVLDPNGNPITWVEVLPHRVWARRFIQPA